MTTGTDFRPVFGPNGAVLNAPSMTPEMRAKIEEAAKPPTRAVVFREIRFFVLCGAAPLLVMNYVPAIYDLVQGSQWWSGVVTGVVATLYVFLLVRMIRHVDRRWEVSKRSSETRVLIMPSWGRWTLAGADALTAAAYATSLAILLVRPALILDGPYMVAGLAPGLFGSLSLGLRYAAEKFGWTWRAAS